MRLNEMDIAQRSRYISTVYQNPKTQFYCVESTDELAFPLENRNLPKDEMVKIIKKYTELLDTEKLLNRNIFSLSGGEKQLMAITSVMTMDNQVYLFDEPSASLDHHSIGLLKKCIAELKRKGKIVIIAEHRLYYLKEIMDYLAVLKEGKLEMISVEDLDHDKICRLKETYALRSFEEIRKEELLSDNPCYQIQMLNKTKNGEKDKNILKCKNFAQSFKNTKIMDIGEIGFSEGIYFIIGENGVGKSTFIKKMAKLLKGKGKSFYCGNEIKRSYEYISMVMQDVNYQIFTESVWSEISIVSQDDAKKERVLKELMLYDKKDSHPQSLSGGEKQRLMIALAIVSLKPIVILDEPTSGLCKGQMASTVKYTSYILKVVGNTTAKTKLDVPELVKKVQENSKKDIEGNGWQDAADYNIDEVIPYKLTGTLPSNYAEYETYFYEFNDIMSAGLTFDKMSVKVTVDGTTLTADQDYSLIVHSDTNSFQVRFENLKAIQSVMITSTSQIVVEYKCRLNGNAVIAGNGNPNTAYLVYSNNPNQSGGGDHGKTPEDKNVVFTYKVVVNKKDEENHSLQGAQFELRKIVNDQDEGTKIDTVTVTEGTKFNFKGLDAGKYKLIETVTPSGYNTIQPIIFTIEATYDEESDDPQLTSLTGQTEGEIVFIRKTEEREDSLSTDVINKKGIQLPETGGMGRYLIYTLGTIFVLTALGYTVYKRNRKHTEK